MSQTQPSKKTAPASVAVTDAPQLLMDLRQLIELSRQAAAATVNAGLTLMHWHIG